MPKSGKATRAASEREERERNIKLSHAHAAIDEHESAPHAPPSATDAASDAPSVSSARPSTPSRPYFGLRLACGRMRRPGCDGLCAVVLRNVGAEVPAWPRLMPRSSGFCASPPVWILCRGATCSAPTILAPTLAAIRRVNLFAVG